MHAGRAVALLALGMLCTTTGCGSLVRGAARSHDVAPNGLARADDLFRRALVTGGYAGAYVRSHTPKSGAPDDALLRALYRGVTGYYAGEYAASARAFGDADRMVDERATKSLSRGALSVVVNDQVLPYLPTRTERLFLRYYAMLAHARQGEGEGAVVEARQLGRLLEDASAALAPAERALHATMREAAGAVFESAGERNDALVSYRNAALLRGMSRRDVDSITMPAVPADSAAVVLLVESGFVAHRVDRGLTIALDASEWSDSASTAAAGRIATRVAAALASLPDGGVFASESPAHGDSWRRRALRVSDSASTFVRISWPALVRSWTRDQGMTVVRAGDSVVIGADRAPAVPVGPGADVSDALAADFRRDQPRVIARLLARAVAKGAVSDALEKRHGEWAGLLASMAGSALERADTRSWHLLPGTLAVVRLTAPAGEGQMTLRVGDGLDATSIQLPAVSLRPGETRVLTARVWRDASAMAPPLTANGRAASVDTSAVRARTAR